MNASIGAIEALELLFSKGFPAFITADPVGHAYIGRVRERFAEFNIMLVDEMDQPAATGWAVPIRWDGDVLDLPWGYSDTLRRAIDLYEAGGRPDTFVICGAVVNPTLSRRGVAADLITALLSAGEAAGLVREIAPVRPTLKHRYPLTPIDTYARWARPDGLPFDPWLRTHMRFGGRSIPISPHSQTMRGTVAQWEEWTGMEFPSTGSYVIPSGISPLYIDREQDLGTYTEPNVWVRHR